jgi:hypothetical protein
VTVAPVSDAVRPRRARILASVRTKPQSRPASYSSSTKAGPARNLQIQKVAKNEDVKKVKELIRSAKKPLCCNLPKQMKERF